MARRIIGQFGHTDLVSIEHLVSVIDNPEQLDTTTLTNKQKYAFIFGAMAAREGISWSLLKEIIKAVLFWGESEDKVSGIEIKMMRNANKDKIKEFRQLWSK